VYFQSVTTEESRIIECSANGDPAILTMSVQYVANDDSSTGKLVIYIKVRSHKSEKRIQLHVH